MHTYCKNKGIDLSVLLRNEYTAACIRKYGFRDWESVCAAIGHGGLKEGQVVNKLQDEYNKKNKRIVSDAQVHEVIENAKEAKAGGRTHIQRTLKEQKRHYCGRFG